MPNYRGRIMDLVANDDYSLNRVITGLAVGEVIESVAFSVKATEVAADPPALQIVATTTLTAAGQVVDTGATDQEGAVLLTPTRAQTVLLVPGMPYFYDIKVQMTSGKERTIERGTLVPLASITGTIP